MSAVSCAKTTVNPMKHIVDGDITLAQLGEYDRTVRVRRRCGLLIIRLIHRESKKGATLTMAITLSILGGFAQLFHCCKEQ